MTYLEPRFGGVPAGAPHYESFYLTASHPTERTAVWIRHTVHQVPGEAATASVWFTLFGPDGPRAAKVTVPSVAVHRPRGIVVDGLAEVDLDHATGALSVSGTDVAWDLQLRDPAPPLSHLSKPWMYTAPVPRTKSTSPAPDLRISGTVTVDGTTIALDGWRGMLGHNWGTEHAHRWIWLRGASFVEQPDAWLDVVIGRIKVGPVVVPWVANGVLELDGVRHRVGGARRYPRVTERPDGCDLVLGAPGLAITAAVQAPRELSVGWRYADPGGGEHQVRNCSVAGLALTLTGKDGRARTLSTPDGGVYELGSHEFDPALVMQPYADG